MSYSIRNSNLQNIPRKNAKGNYPLITGNVVLVSGDGKNAIINKPVSLELTETDTAAMDSLWARLDAVAAEHLKDANS